LDDFKKMMEAPNNETKESDDESSSEEEEEDTFDSDAAFLSPSLGSTSHSLPMGLMGTPAKRANTHQLEESLNGIFSAATADIIKLIKHFNVSGGHGQFGDSKEGGSRSSITHQSSKNSALRGGKKDEKGKKRAKVEGIKSTTFEDTTDNNKNSKEEPQSHTERLKRFSGTNRATARSSQWNPMELQRFQKKKAIPGNDRGTLTLTVGGRESLISDERSRRQSNTLKRVITGARTSNVMASPQSSLVPDALRGNGRQKKRTMFASVSVQNSAQANADGLKTLSRSTNQKADQLKAILAAKQRKREASLVKAASLREKERSMLTVVEGAEDYDDVEKEEGKVTHTVEEGTVDEKAEVGVDGPSEEQLTSELLALSQGGHDPEATFLLVDSLPYMLISHDSAVAGSFNSLVLVLVVFQSFQFPFEIFFSDEDLGQNIEILGSGTRAYDFLTYLIFLVDFSHNFFKTYCDSMGDLVIDWNAIAKHYFFSAWFWIDLISCFPFELFGGGDSAAIKSLKLMRLCRMGKLLKKIDTVYKAGALRLIRIMGVIVLVFHWVSCGWFKVGKLWLARLKGFQYNPVDVPYNFTRLTHSEEEASIDFVRKFVPNLTDQYASSLHQASTSLMGGGVAISSSEQAFFFFCTVCGAVLQATIFGSIAVLLASLDEDYVTYQRKMIKINHRMAYLMLPQDLQERVRTYYQNMWNTDRAMTTDPDAFINEVSRPLAGDIRMKLYEQMLGKVSFFQNTDISMIVLEELVMRLKTSMYLEGDLVMRKGESGDWMGFIGKGQVAILSPNNGEVIRVMEEGQYLGEMALLYRVNRTVDVRAISWVTMHALSMNDMANVKAMYPDDIEMIENDLENVMVQKQYQHVAVPKDSEWEEESSSSSQTDDSESGSEASDDENSSQPPSISRQNSRGSSRGSSRKTSRKNSSRLRSNRSYGRGITQPMISPQTSKGAILGLGDSSSRKASKADILLHEVANRLTENLGDRMAVVGGRSLKKLERRIQQSKFHRESTFPPPEGSGKGLVRSPRGRAESADYLTGAEEKEAIKNSNSLTTSQRLLSLIGSSKSSGSLAVSPKNNK